ncbi:MAG TPA: hypothetical protein PLQ35_11565 [bacterium]|nr:hypothetical protein [bacterium]
MPISSQWLFSHRLTRVSVVGACFVLTEIVSPIIRGNRRRKGDFDARVAGVMNRDVAEGWIRGGVLKYKPSMTLNAFIYGVKQAQPSI